MIDDAWLLHEPEGDRNPYDPVRWSRTPLAPTNKEPFEVGVRSSEGIESVTLEWRCVEETGSVRLANANDVWLGSCGPFETDCEYRFLAEGGDGVATATEWFPVSVTRSSQVEFKGVGSDGEQIHIYGDGVRLSLRPRDSSTIQWTLDAVPGAGDLSRSIETLGWTAHVDGGSVVVSRGEDTLVLSVEKAEADGQVRAWNLKWQLDRGEQIWGTGERFDSLDQRDMTPDVRVYEEYKQQGARTYFPLPWMLSSNGYGLAIDTAARVRFDFGSTNSDQAIATIPSTADAGGVWYFGSPKEIIQAYTADVGRPSPMPIWAYGPWMSGNEWDSDERIREVVDRTHAEGIPATVIVIEAWSDESTFYLFNDTDHDLVPGADPVPVEAMRHSGKWPDPRRLVKWLHGQGIRVLLWQIPVLKDTDSHDQHRADLEHAEESDLCVGTTEDRTYRNRGWWFPNSRIIDFTNPEARQWWFSKRAYLLDEIGVDGFKTDGGEHLWGSDVLASDGTSGHEAANRYPTHYLGAYHEFMREHGRDKPLTFSRAGFTGSQSFPAHWAGDEDSTWEAYRASLTAGLSAGTSGIAFWGWDLAGFSKTLPSAELYKRSTAMAAFTPVMQYHSEHNEHRLPLADRTPWNIAEQTRDEDVMSVYRFYAQVRMNLIPYLLTIGTEAVQTGVPMMRAMALEYPDDSVARGIDDQFFLGSDVLVAPVMTPGAEERRIYIPDDGWWDLWSGERVNSGWVTVPTLQDQIPVYVRAGACIPLWQQDVIGLGTPVELPGPDSGRLVLMVFPGSAESTITNPLTFQQWTAKTIFDGSTFTIHTTDAPAGVTVWLRSTSTLRLAQYFEIPAGSAETTIRAPRHE